MSQSSYRPYNSEEHSNQDMDYKIDDLENIFLRACTQTTQKTWFLMVARLKRERLIAQAALLKSKVMLAEMQIFLAENELSRDKNNEKLGHNKDKLSGSRPTPRHRRDTPYSRGFTPSSSSRRSSISSTSSNRSRSDLVFSTAHSPMNTQNEPLPRLCGVRLPSVPTNSPSIKSPAFQDQNPVASLNKTKSNSSTNSNKSLSDSIIAEFDKSYQKSVSFGSIPMQNMPFRVPQKKSQDIKINPVSNMTAYNKSYALRHKLDFLFNPNVRPPLHPKDPRAYSKLSLESKEQRITQTPMTLAVPKMLQNEGQKYVPPPSKRTQNISNSHPSSKLQDKIIQECFTTPIKNLNQSNMTTSTPVKHSDPRLKPLGTPVKYAVNRQNMSVSIPPSILKNQNTNSFARSDITPPNFQENRNILGPILQNNIEHRDLTMSTPQKWFENKHICVPVSPMFTHKTSSFLSHSNAKDGHQSKSFTAMSDSSHMKENRSPHAAKRVKFYHSS